MTKKSIRSKSTNPVVWLFIAAIFVEVTNILLTTSLGSTQADVCPKSTLPWSISVCLSTLSATLVLAAMIGTKNKLSRLYVLFFALFWILVIFIAAYFLRFAAVGGLDWCSFLGR